MREVEGRSNTAVFQFQSWCGSEDSGSLAGDEHDSVFVTVLENVPIATQDSQAHVAFDEVPTFVAVGYDVLPVDWIGLVVGGFHDSFVHGLVRVGVVVGVVSGDYADGAVVVEDWLVVGFGVVHLFSLVGSACFMWTFPV